MRISDESDAGFSWISGSPDWLERASHALAADGGVWLVDPVELAGLDERVRALGEPRAVLQLFGQHGRDCAAVAARLGVPLLVTPAEVPGSPFELVAVPGIPGWHETALWWPATKTLVVVEAVGTAPYFCVPGQPVGIHPVIRLFRPPKVVLGYEPERLLVGHGANLHENVPAALRRAVAGSRRDTPRVVKPILRRKHPVGRSRAT